MFNEGVAAALLKNSELEGGKPSFNEVVAVALCKKVISVAGKENRINYTKLLKLVYLIERQMYESFREFITNDDFVSMPYGPVPSTLCNLIRGEIYNDSILEYWKENFTTDGYDLVDKKVENEKKLNNKQNLVADKTLLFFKDYNWRELVDILHEICPEYKETAGSIPITVEDIHNSVSSLTAEDIARKIESA